MPALEVLIVEDQPAVSTALEVLFEIRGIACCAVRGPEEALRVLAGESGPGIGVVLQDMNFSPEATSGEEGVALFREIRRRDPLCREIVEAHGGRLRIERREGGGTAVVCWVPG